MNTILEIKSLSKSFDKNTVVKNVNLSVTNSNILAIVGESGSGKTTLIRLIAGLETQDSGQIKLNNTVIASDTVYKQPEKRNIGLVFQDYALFPHFTVFDNVSYGISKHVNKKQRVDEVLKIVGLEGLEKRFPHQLSGGQQQRVALARALAPNPALLILDEPFSNLDYNLRIQLRNDIFSIIKQTGITAIFVTHDTQDAIAIADQIVVFKDGEIKQQATPKELYSKPKSFYVASLFSPLVNLLPSDLESFNFKFQNNKRYALRIDDFKIDKDNDFNHTVTIQKSQFFQGKYLNTITLQNKKVLNFYSVSDLSNQTVVVGFKNDSLFIFDA
ncbi:ABC transporter ATP-binding protein [Lacinutrix salivirga]